MSRAQKGAAAKTSAQKITYGELAAKAVELRKQRYTYAEIGEEIGRSRSAACRMVQKELAKAAEDRKNEAGVLLDLELAELDALAKKAWKFVEGGSETAIDRALRINESRRKLLGLDKQSTELDGALKITIIDDIGSNGKDNQSE